MNSRDAGCNEADSKLSASSGARPEPPAFSFSRSLARFWHDGRQHYGAWRTIRELAWRFCRAMAELRPSYRQSRYGDLDFDLEQSMNTTRANVSFRNQLSAMLVGSLYYASDPWLFAPMMDALQIPFEQFTFLDLGSGKGRALFMAAERPFHRIIGVELMPELHHVCLKNIYAFNKSRSESGRLEAFCMDARDFHFPSEPLVIYLYNPFPEPVLAVVLEKLRGSAFEDPRPIFIAYRYVEHENLLAASDWLTKIAGTDQWVIYGNRRDRT